MSNSRSKKALSLFTAAVLTLVSFVIPATPVMAQATTGNIVGTVTDATGGAVVGAKVTAKNKATGQELAAETTSEGGFRIANLAPGAYDVTVEQTGFKKGVYTDFAVNIGTDNSLNPVLTAGDVSESVTVVAGGEEIAQVTSQISSSFESRKVEELPSNAAGGGIDTIALLAPGVVPGFGNVNSNGTTLNVNGNRARSNNFTLDGTDNNDLSVGGPVIFVSNQDSVQEFQITTSNYSAQYGRNLGAVINIVTKGGGNEFHGTGFLFHRNSSALDAKTNSERADPNRGDTRDKFISNVVGGTFGGPIIRDKAFFFVDGQLIRQRQQFLFQPTAPAITPAGLTTLAAAFPNNPAVTALVNQSLFALVPNAQVASSAGTLCFPRDPTLACTGANAVIVPTAFGTFTRALPFDQKEFGLRGDVNPTNKDSFNVKYRYQESPEQNFNSQTNGFFGDIPFTSRNINGQYTRQITSRAVNQFSAAYQKLKVEFGGCSGETDPLKGCIVNAADIGTSFTNITFTGVIPNGTTTSLLSVGPATNVPQGREVSVTQFADNFQYTAGRHQLIMGVDFRFLDNSVPFLPNFNGAFRFPSTARIVANAPSFVTIGAGEPIISYKERDQFYYFQDDWKVKENLTLNLGLRYEYTGQPINTLNELTLARESNPATALFRQDIPIDQRIVPRVAADKNNFAPRFGFAYSPRWGNGDFSRFLVGENDATVIRGGYSIAYDPAFYNILLNVSSSAPNVFLNTINNNTSLTAPTFRLPANPTGEAVRSALGSFLQRNTFDPRLLTQTQVGDDFHSPYSQQWSLGVQRQINRNNVAEIRYVGNRGVGLFQTVNRNPDINRLYNGFSFAGFDFPNFRNLLPAGVVPLSCVNNPATPDNEAACNNRVVPGRGLIRSRENTGNSFYHGLQTRYNGRLWNQLTFGAAYTFSKTIDTASEIFAFGENAISQNPFDVNRGERGLSGSDRPHAASMNFLWDIPYKREQNGFAGRLLGGWQINGTYVLASGRPFTPSQFINVLGVPTYQDVGFTAAFFGFDSLRPFAANASAPRTAVGISDIDAFFFYTGAFEPSPTGFYSLNELNTTGNLVPVTLNDVRFVLNAPGSAKYFNNPFGTVLRNSERGPALNQLNLAFFKNTKVTEGVRVQFRAELFNALNHPNPGYGVAAEGSLPDIFIEDAGVQGGAGSFTGFNDKQQMQLSSRRVQFGLRIIF